MRQQTEGGSWHVRLSLARTGLWLRQLGRVADGYRAGPPDFAGVLETCASGYGRLTAVRHAARFDKAPAGYHRPSVPPGTDRLAWL